VAFKILTERSHLRKKIKSRQSLYLNESLLELKNLHGLPATKIDVRQLHLQERRPPPSVSGAPCRTRASSVLGARGVRGKQMDEARDLKCADYGMH